MLESNLDERGDMKSLWTVMLACALAIASIDADAARMGGGRSFGRQSGNVTQRQATPPAQPGQSASNASRPASATPSAPTAPSRPGLGGILGGVAAGLGLAWLAHSLGLGAAFGNVLLILLLALAAMVVWRVLSSRGGGGGLAYQGAGRPVEPVMPAQYSPKNVGNDASARPWERNHAAFDPAGSPMGGAAAGGGIIGSALAGSQAWGTPAGFDTEGFLAAAKRNFVTLQDAWDRADITTLRSMMTNEMIGEIRQQLAEREAHTGGQSNKTEVVMLDAKLLGIEELPDGHMASVEFSGMIREDLSAGPGPFREVWNMTKPTHGGGWLVAGVQALQ
jgi:predicted lipid-binding transport protein (Tim44 family)